MSVKGSPEIENNRGLFRNNIIFHEARLEVTSMYEVAGQAAINLHTSERFLWAGKRWGKKIARQVIKGGEIKRKPDVVEDISKYEKAGRLLREVFRAGDFDFYVKAINLKRSMPDIDFDVLITEYLETGCPDDRIKAAELGYHSIEKRDDFCALVTQKARADLESGDKYRQFRGAEMIRFATLSDRPELIRGVFNSGNAEAKIVAAEAVYYSCERESEREKLGELITREVVAQLKSGDLNSQIRAVEMIEYAAQTEKLKLFELAREVAPNAFIAPPLYNRTCIDNVRFARVQFDKDGSRTTLAGGSLKDKAIIRHIKPEAFIAWHSLFKNAELWQNSGFDYVPIEPIISYSLRDQGLVDVFSGVLDLNFQQWQDRGGDWIDDLKAERDRILTALDQQNVRHGNVVDRNFCLRFYRDDSGRVDLSRKSRIYLIDFDQARHI